MASHCVRRLTASDCMQVRLPGGLLVQAAFHPQEPVENVLTLALSCLEERVSDVSLRPYLFTTPPRNVLNMQASLAEAGLVPAATAILAWHAPLPEPLASLTGEALLRPFALALLSVTAGTSTDAPVPVAAFPQPRRTRRLRRMNRVRRARVPSASASSAAARAALPAGVVAPCRARSVRPARRARPPQARGMPRPVSPSGSKCEGGPSLPQ